ncbi:MAG: dihydroneopterin aldolase [Rhodospirillaceae bacterium]
MTQHPRTSAQGPERVIEPLRIADAGTKMRHVFVRDLVLLADIGVHAHEHGQQQRIRVNLDLGVHEQGPHGDMLTEVVCYEDIITRVRGVVADGHVNLAETMAERIADICLQDSRVRSARVRVEKLDVFEDVSSVGVELERYSALPR